MKIQLNNVHFHYSIFANNDLSKSMRYLYCIVLNAKRFLSDRNTFSNCKMILHTDAFTKKILSEMFSIEKLVDSSKQIEFSLHNRNDGIRGMFWRLACLYDDSADIAVSAEADESIYDCFKRLLLFTKDESAVFFGVVNKNCNERNMFLNGNFLFRPGLIDNVVKREWRNCLKIFDNIQNLKYSYDETFSTQFILKYMRDVDCILKIQPSRFKTLLHEEDIETELPKYKALFKNAKLLTNKAFDDKIAELGFEIIDKVVAPKLVKEGGKRLYCYKGKRYNIAVLNREPTIFDDEIYQLLLDYLL